jgi:formamidopyrimidine-DNA glycosylase
MPELPEVEIAARRLAGAALGKTIGAVRVLHPALRRRLPDDRAASLVGAVVESIERRGKHQLLHLRDGRVLAAHFRMSGDWSVGAVDHEPARHARAMIDLTDGTRIALVDPRALATLELSTPTALDTIGIDAIDARFTPEVLAAGLARKRSAIKPALLDQRVVAGLGNIYAAEALWRARISPGAPADRLSAERVRRLHRAIRETLARARRSGARYRATVAGEERPGRFEVYDREGEPCRRCGAPIRRSVQAGRSTYYCPVCQRR